MLFAAYAWRADESDAEFAPLGVTNARGTVREIPPFGACFTCHGKLEERVIGFSVDAWIRELAPAPE